MAGRRVIGVQGTSAFLIALDDPKNVHAQAVIVERRDGQFHLVGEGSLPLQSILARGYWENWNGSADDEQAILAAVPQHPPVVFSV